MKNRMKAIRLYRELTQKEFAKMLNVDQTAISNWETQKNNPDLSIATKVSEDFKLPLDFIYGKEFIITRPIVKWRADERKDMENANPKARDVFLFKYGRGVFENDEIEKPADEGELGKDMFVWHRNGEDGQVKLSDETYEAIINLIKTFSEKPKDI